MALKQVILSRKIADKEEALKALRATREDQEKRKAAMATREAELEEAVKEVTEETAEEDRAELDKAVADFEAEGEALDAEMDGTAKQIGEAEAEVASLRSELEALNRKLEADKRSAELAKDNGGAGVAPGHEERSENIMSTREAFKGMTRAEFAKRVEGEACKGFLTRVKEFAAQKRAVTGGELLIPEFMLGLIREVAEESSKLLKYVNLQRVPGRARQTIMGTIPEAVWTEMCGKLNELALSFSGVEVDGYKVGGFIPVCNALLADNDVALASQIIYALGRAIGLALDKAIVYGTGVKMPKGIVPRLAQTEAPSDYPATAPVWVDLHSTNIVTIAAANSTGLKLFQAILAAFGNAKKKYGAGGKFFAMNEKTHMVLVSEAMSINAAGAVVTGISGTMPVIGGDIVELDFIPDNVIIAGYGENYLLVEREGTGIDQSEHVLFTADQTVFRGKARYDGMPVIPQAFVAIGINAATVSADAVTFAGDTANTPEAIILPATATVAVGAKIKLTPVIMPYGVRTTITWASATAAKATVDTAGEVTGVATGTSVITATTANGLTAQCTVTVTA